MGYERFKAKFDALVDMATNSGWAYESIEVRVFGEHGLPAKIQLKNRETGITITSE